MMIVKMFKVNLKKGFFFLILEEFDGVYLNFFFLYELFKITCLWF